MGVSPLLELRGLHAFYGQSHVLHGVDLQVDPGEIVCLLGRNGSGRSTLLRAAMGLAQARGSLRWRGRECLGLRPFEMARLGLGFVPEDRQVFPSLTVRQNLALGVKPAPWLRPGRPAAGRWSMDALLDLFPRLRERLDVPAGALSGGDQPMLALCRTMMGDPELVMVDEPTEGLAPQWVAQVAGFLHELRRRGVAVLLVEQKLSIALDVATRCCVVAQGRIAFEGSPAQLRVDDAVQRQWLAV